MFFGKDIPNSCKLLCYVYLDNNIEDCSLKNQDTNIVLDCKL